MTEERKDSEVLDGLIGQIRCEEHRMRTTQAHMVSAGFNIGTEEADGCCLYCRREGKVARRRKNTAYVDEKRNWMESCRECFQEAVEYYADLWQQYYADVM